MIPSATTDIQRSGNMTSQTSVAMTFDENSIAHIMSVLTDLYSDPELAIIREYSTNARDSHIEACQTRPIEVTTPSPLSPTFVVRDYGVGMSVDDIERIYSKYGASTKRGTDEQTGMLGLGCKSGLTYANQFTVTAVKNGIKTVVIVGRRDDGTGVMDVVDTVSTTEPNGVTITIPALRNNALHQKAEKFFGFWERGTVLLNGKEPVPVTESGNKVADGLYMVPQLGSDYIVMGGVAYDVGNELYNNGYRYGWNAFGVVAFVPMGTVNFTPSREKLHKTKRTETAIADIRDLFVKNALAAAQAAIASAPDHRAALRTFNEWTKVMSLRINDFEYQGDRLQNSWNISSAITFDTYAKRYSTGYKSWIGVDDLNNCLVIDASAGIPSDLTTTHRAKIRRYIEDNSLSVRRVVITTDMPWDKWVETATCDWDDIASIRLNSKTRTRFGSKFSLYSKTGFVGDVDTLDTTKPIVFFGPRDEIDYWSVQAAVDADTQIVKINKNRWDKFQRTFPNAVHVTDWARASIAKWVASLSDLDLEVLNGNSNRYSPWGRLDSKRINDPDVVAALATAQSIAKHSVKVPEFIRHLGRIGAHPAYPASKIKVMDIRAKYPLTQALFGYSITPEIVEELYVYINNKYAQEA